MQVYKLTKVNKMGENDPKYGATYWANVEGGDLPVMFNSSASYVPDGATITAEEQEVKVSAKGTNYLRLKKVKLAEPDKKEEQKTETSMNSGNFKLLYSELRALNKKVDKLLGEDVVVDVDPDEEISLNDIPF